MFTESIYVKDMAAKSLKAGWRNKPTLRLLGRVSSMIFNANVWEVLSSPQVQNIARITVIKFPILNTHKMKNIQQIHLEFDLTVIKYRQILPNGLHSARRWSLQKYT